MDWCFLQMDWLPRGRIRLLKDGFDGLVAFKRWIGFLQMDTNDGVLAKSWLGLLNGDLVRQTFQNVSKRFCGLKTFVDFLHGLGGRLEVVGPVFWPFPVHVVLEVVVVVVVSGFGGGAGRRCRVCHDLA